ncbi:MAG: hypothetical protein GKR97_08595 [Rhizobiaceae bacterium]|nr:hypothetical protein [Rhizobiaceae bacterium]
MDSKTNRTMFRKKHSKQSDISTMGERYIYRDAARESMGQIAHKIGFSSDEISELKRLYLSEFKGIKQ